jgi:PAS domain S-box-containing protein
MKISNRMLITFGAIYIMASIIIVVLVNYNMRKQALIEAESKALMLINHNLAIHNYFQQELKPKLFSWSELFRPPDYFEPTWMSSTYAIRQVNHHFKLLEKSKYYYKECAINARTPENEADPHEKIFLEQLSIDPKLVERSEVQTLNGRPIFVIMRRGLEMEKSCLRCHSTPDRVPGDLVKIYGPTRSFGRLEGEVVHAISIRIPLAEAYGQANRLSWHLSGILLALLGCLFASQTWISKRWLFDPMAALRQKALEIAESEARLGETIPVPPGPELRDLTTAFNAMSRNLRQSHDSLEERVRQRTVDLNRLNERLKQDLLQRKQTEEALRESQQKLLSIFRVAPVGIGLVFNRVIQEANETLCRMTGYSREQLVGQNARMLYPTEEDYNYVGAEKYQQIAERGTGTVETRWKRQDGEIMHLIVSSTPMDATDLSKGVTFTALDITERKRAEDEKAKLEAQLVQAQKMEAIGTLAGGIAHDFNNILTAIIGNISLAMLDLQMEEQGRQRLTEAGKACLQAQNLSRQLLTFSRGGAPIKEVVSVKRLITESASFACRGSKVNYEFNLPDDLWAMEADPGQISQVFQNLVINAIQAMPTGGMIKIHGENLEVASGSELPLNIGRYVRISIQDKGIGITREHLPRIFDPYFTTKQKGSGLGLATSYSIIKNHSGYIAVESELGIGTTFKVYLPASDRQVIQPPKEDTELLSGKGKILVMDDEAMVREVLGKMLLALGYEVKSAEDGAEAIEFFRQSQKAGDPFAAVILDLTVPGRMGGREAMARLLKIDPQVKAIVSSGYSDDPIMADFQKYGFTAVIAKPYKIAELGKVLNKALTEE